MKDYIRDDGKMRLCDSNIAKFNILEFMWYHKHRIPEMIGDSLGFIWTGVIGICGLTFSTILLPITFPISAYVGIRESKRVVKNYGEWNNGYVRE